MDGSASKKQFVSGVSVLTLSALLVKVIGLVYKIPLLHLLGAEGMGYFNAAYEIYTLFFVISTAGLPVAVSILIAESAAQGRIKNVARIHRLSFGIFSAIGFLGMLIMICLATSLSEWLGSRGAHLSVVAIAPTVLFVCASGALRGFFQGCGNMVPTAISQVFEALGKLFLGLIFAYLAVKKRFDPSTCAAFAVLGVTVGSLGSAIYLLIQKSVVRAVCSPQTVDLSAESGTRIVRRLIVMAVPITVASSFSGFSRIVDMAMILRRLQDIGFSAQTATAMYGTYSTLAVPVYHLPASLLSGMSVALVPSLTAAIQENNAGKASALMESAFHLCAVVAFPLSAGITVFGKPILSVLFAGEDAAVAMAAPLLSVLGLSVFSCCLSALTSAVLQAYKRVALPIASVAVGTALKTVLAYSLIGNAGIGLLGAPISTFFGNLGSVAFNLYFMDRETHISCHLGRVFGRPLVMTVLSMLGAVLGYAATIGVLGERASFLLASAVCVFLYLFLSCCLGVLAKEDILSFPMGDKILLILKKMKFIKINQEG